MAVHLPEPYIVQCDTLAVGALMVPWNGVVTVRTGREDANWPVVALGQPVDLRAQTEGDVWDSQGREALTVVLGIARTILDDLPRITIASLTEFKPVYPLLPPPG